MTDMSKPEVWLRGPIAGVPPLLQPVAHSLLQCREEIDAAISDLTPEQIWREPDGAASLGFHVRHASGSLDRLFTYARGSSLSEAQRAALAEELRPDATLTAADLLAAFGAAVDRALQQVGTTDERMLTDQRSVGRAQLPSTVIGLLFHAAEHMQRHAGQIATTARLALAAQSAAASRS
jgi:uncharacterized damage-inducible protein DinB